MASDVVSSATPTFPSHSQTVADASSATTEQAIGPAENFAGSWLADFRRAIEGAGLRWHAPHVASADNEISFEWWKGRHNLTVFVRGFGVEVVRSWGTNLRNEMDTRVILGPDDATETWRWLLGA